MGVTRCRSVPDTKRNLERYRDSGTSCLSNWWLKHRCSPTASRSSVSTSGTPAMGLRQRSDMTNIIFRYLHRLQDGPQQQDCRVGEWSRHEYVYNIIYQYRVNDASGVANSKKPGACEGKDDYCVRTCYIQMAQRCRCLSLSLRGR